MSAGPYGIVPVQVVEDLWTAATSLRSVLPQPWRAEVYWDECVATNLLHVWRLSQGVEFPCYIAQPGDWFLIATDGAPYWGVTWMPAQSAPDALAFFQRIAIELSAVESTETGRFDDEGAAPDNVIQMPPTRDPDA